MNQKKNSEVQESKNRQSNKFSTNKNWISIITVIMAPNYNIPTIQLTEVPIPKLAVSEIDDTQKKRHFNEKF